MVTTKVICGRFTQLQMMNIGQKSLIVFISRFGSSVIGFVAMVYFARTLGSGVLGLYFLTVALVSWLKVASGMGIRLAITKRISEGKERGAYVMAGFLLILTTFSLVSLGVIVFRGHINQYLGEPLYQYVLILLGAEVIYMYVGSIIRGENFVHLDGSLRLVNTVLRVLVQFTLVSLGLGAVGLLLGESAGVLFISLLGLAFLLIYFDDSIRFDLPEKKHFISIINYAKFSWLNSIRGKTYNLMDTVVLGFFVSNSLIGIYSICWNVSAVLTLFSKSVLSVLFPEMSKLSSQDKEKEVGSHIEDALSYTGLLIIPGFIGAVVVGDSILNIYGGEFQKGHTILIILVGAGLVQSYYLQLINGMDALNRPELSFRVNAVFVISNMSLNFVLVYLYSWIGAAFATLLSTSLALAISYRMLSGILEFSAPHRQITLQIVSGLLMGGAVHVFTVVISLFGFNPQRFVPVLMSVAFGAGVYFAVLFITSREFRNTVFRNLPVDRVLN
jgi:O-antigen/teichoic acid export membrane protein